MIEAFDPELADLKDATPREWLAFVTAPSFERASKYAIGTVIEVFAFSEETETALRSARNDGYVLETRKGTQADAAGWLAGKAEQARALEAQHAVTLAKRRTR